MYESIDNPSITETDGTSIDTNPKKKTLSRFDDCLNKKLENQQKLTAELPSAPSSLPSSSSSSKNVFVEEFLPSNSTNEIFPILRRIFVDSFNQYYKEIEEKLRLKTNQTLVQWLDETFDEMQDEMVQRETRCFMLRSIDKNDFNQGIIGFLTLKEEENGSIYIAQCAIDAQNKRSGYGGQLIRHLRNIYPAGTYYWGLCRRENRPAVNFYLKQGATFIDDEHVGKKYGYDTQLYTGFQFHDNTSENVLSRQTNNKLQDTSTMTDPLLNSKTKRSWRQKARRCCCCVMP